MLETMKKLMIVLGLTVLAVSNVNAQNKASNVSLGPIAGFGHSWVSDMKGMEFKPSAHMGARIIYSNHPNWGWGADLTASHEGFTQEYMQNGQEYNFTVDPTYLRLTPKAYYFFGKPGGNVRPKVFLGPSAGLLLIEDKYMKNETTNNRDVTYGDGANQMYKRADFGAEGGAGVNIKIAPATWLNLDGSYYRGLMDATQADNTNPAVDVKNRNMRLNVGVLMGL
jgi:outer membrane protein W